MTYPPSTGREGPLGPLPPVFRIPPARRRFRGPPRWILVIAAFIAILIVANIAKDIVAELLWFDSVGYRSAYTTRITTKIWLFAAGAVAGALLIIPNVLVARRLAPSADAPGFEVSPELEELFKAIESPQARRVVAWLGIGVAILVAIILGSTAAGEWQSILLLMHAKEFGVEDPQFHRDLGFYVFELPAYRFVLGWLVAAIVLALVGSGIVYAFRAVLYGFRIDGPRPILRNLGSLEAPRAIKIHLSMLILALLVLLVVRYYLDRFELLYSTRGADIGAFYTDLHAALPMLYVRMAVAVIAAALLIGGLFRRGILLPLAAVGLWLAGSVLTAVYPPLLQRFFVQPNEFSREQPYLARNLEMTRFAYGLDSINEKQFPANPQATEDEVAANEDTIANVRLWDPEPLRAGLGQIQTIRPLFEFLDVDVDRYTIDGKYRQVMLAARELNSNRLPAEAQTWVNRRLQFTHGYGFTVAAVNEAQPDGSPTLIVRDIPLQGPLETTRPEVYFGEQPDNYIIVDGKEPEFTPLAGGLNVQTRFEGNGGIRLSSLWRRALYAWTFTDPNILISGAIGENSRLIYRRNIRERIQSIAPFLQLDADPYLVIDDANLYWVQDAYTVTNNIPYAHRTGDVNYMRNSVKVVVNAYSGDTSFYMSEPDEPILKTYAAIFPHLFKPLDQMPAKVRAHIRYPEDLFRLQTTAYLRYHIKDTRQFYQKEDQWAIPSEFFNDREQAVRPYYVIARLPGGTEDEFMLILPFVPRGRTNAIAWIAARSDGDNYGELVAFRFPETESVPGPTQVERRIDSDGRVSQQLTLWNQSGSKVIRGNLLMIPIGNANLFFEPLYLSATGVGNEIPQLKRVVVVNGEDVAMEPTLGRALAVLFGRASPSGLDSSGAAVPSPASTPTPGAAPPTPTPAPTPGALRTPVPPGGDVASLVAQANASYERAQTLLRNGDFAGYGAEVARLKEILEQLQQLTGTPTPGR